MPINDRQRLMLNRLLDGFEGRIVQVILRGLCGE